ncbi:MAG: zf-HC2 domain-containing protein, partial [Planctomycetota bacterium]|nr:zf-HC2 domain-containing protein [Planctomycetota bacterium]
MTHCPDPTEWVLYAAGEMPAPRRDELDDHLAACDACRRELSRLRRGLEALETLEAAPPVRAEALHALRRRLAAEVQRRGKRRPRRRRHPLRWIGAAAAAAAAVVALAVLLTHEPEQPAWPDQDQVDAEITEIAAAIELLESDTSAIAWDFETQDEPTPPKTPAGQSRSDPDDAAARHG